MNFQPIQLQHQLLLNQKFQMLNLPYSEFSFANIYLFRNVHQYEIFELNDHYFIRGLSRDQMHFIMLLDHPSYYPLETIQSVLHFGKFLYPIPEYWISYFSKNIMQMSFKEDESDYLFLRSKFSTYAGRHLSKKRNLVKQLLTQHVVKAYPLLEHKLEAKAILNQWIQENTLKPLETDYEECLEGIQKLETLHLEGSIFYVDNSPGGFVLGERLTSDCFAVHFCKAIKSIKGLYQHIFQDLARSLPESCHWINLEQDLGIATLRESKLSYQPAKSLLKFRLTLS